MILLFHIIAAVAGVIYATYMYFFPSKTKVNMTYGLMALTIGSGTYLLWSLKTHVLQGCVMGLAYVAGVTALIILANRKLATETTRK